jgi:flagellar basal-body rod protein FlgC
MISAIYSALSGLVAFEKKIGVTANNVANVNTDGFKKSRVTLEESQPQGVQAKIQQINTPGPLALEQTPEGESLVEKSNVDISEEMANLIVGQRFYEANLRTLKTEDERLGSLLDIVK